MAKCDRNSLKGGLNELFNGQYRAVLTDLVDSSFNFIDDNDADITASDPAIIYYAQDQSKDIIGDWRQWGDTLGFYTQYCTGGAETKGGGTWLTKHTVQV